MADESLGRAARFNQYIADAREELHNVVWPTREQAVNLTIAVLFVTVVMTVLLSGIDFVFSQMVKWVLAAVGG